MLLRMAESRSSIFYGWYVLAATSLILFISSGARLTIGVMMKPVITEFGWSRSAVSLAVFLNMVVFAISVVIVGKLYDRYGPKWVILVSSLLFSAGYMLMAVMTSFWQFLFLYGFLAAAGTGGTTLSIFAALLSKWFERRRGFAISLGLSGGCLGQFAIVPLFTHMVLAYGWRLSNLFIGLVSLMVNVVLVLLVIKGDPDDLGVEPYGRATVDDRESTGRQVPEPSGVRDLGLGEAMKTRSLWLFAFFMFVCGSGDFLVSTHLIALVTDHGISATTGGNMLAWFGLLSLGGILVAGPASDLIGNRIPIALTFALRVVLFLLILKYQGLISFYFFSLGFGFSFLVTAPLSATLAGRLYGFSHVGAIAGFVHTVHHVGGGLWAYLGGVIFDHTGSYNLAFAISAIMASMAVVSTLLIKETRHQPRESLL
jgi:MFS family permease